MRLRYHKIIHLTAWWVVTKVWDIPDVPRSLVISYLPAHCPPPLIATRAGVIALPELADCSAAPTQHRSSTRSYFRSSVVFPAHVLPQIDLALRWMYFAPSRVPPKRGDGAPATQKRTRPGCKIFSLRLPTPILSCFYCLRVSLWCCKLRSCLLELVIKVVVMIFVFANFFANCCSGLGLRYIGLVWYFIELLFQIGYDTYRIDGS